MPTPVQSRHIALGPVTLHTLMQGDPDRPMILFLHGFPEYSGMWRGLMERFSDRFHCVAPDQRGYNLSSKPPDMADYETPKLADDIVRLMEHLSPGRRVHLVGHDWGAAVAYAVAMSRPDLLADLVIINGVHPGPFQQALIDDADQIAASQYFHRLRSPDVEARLCADDFALMLGLFGRETSEGWLSPAEAGGYIAAWRQPGALSAMLNWYRASPIHVPLPDDDTSDASNPFADTDRLRITPRHLLIWGMQDKALRPAATERLEAYCDDLTRVEIPDGDHWVVNARTDAVAAAMADFYGV